MNQKKLKVIGIVAVLLLLSLVIVGTGAAETTVTTEQGIRDAVASGGDVRLGSNISLNNGELEINKTVTLDLAGHTLNAQSKSGVIYITSSGNLTLKDSSLTNTGKITGGKSTHGGGVYVNGGTFTMNGGTISGNTASSSGGGVYVYMRGTFTMSENSAISENTASYDGGGVYVDMGCTSTMGGNSTISRNNANYGGGVYVYVGGAFTMGENSTISENSATIYGGGVYNNGTFTMNDGTISGNTASSEGADVNNNATFNHNGGDIGGSSPSSIASGDTMHTAGLSETNMSIRVVSNDGNYNMHGGFIYSNCGVGVYNLGSFNQSGGDIVNISPSANGSGDSILTDESSMVAVNWKDWWMSGGSIGGGSSNDSIGGGFYNGGNLMLGGSAIIDNVFLPKGKFVSFLDGDDALIKGKASIGITLEDIKNPGRVFKLFKSRYINEGLIESKNTNCKFDVDENGDPMLDNGSTKIPLYILENGVISGRNVNFIQNPTLTQITFDEDLPEGTSVTYISGLNPKGSSTTGYTLLEGFRVKMDISPEGGGKVYFTADSEYPNGVRLMYFDPSSNGWKLLDTKHLSGKMYEASFDSFSPGFQPLAIVQYSDTPGPEPEPEPTPIVKKDSSSSIVSFRGEKSGNDFVFNAVVVTRATLPGASTAVITNSGSGSGWYKFTLSTNGFTGNGTLYFQVPLDVIDIKGWTVNDVSLFGSTTKYLGNEGQYAKYSASVEKDGTYTIGFEKDAATTSVTPVEEPKTDNCTLSIASVSSLKVGETNVLKVTCSDGHQHVYSWKVNDSTVATIDANGNLNALKAGTVTVTVTDDDGHSATRTITVSPKASAQETSVTDKKDTTKQTTTKSPFPILGILAGLGITSVLVMRRKL